MPIDGVVDVLIPLCRLMIRSELGAGELVRAAKLSFVRAAASEVMPGNSRLNVSHLAVVTGLTRKEVSSLLGKGSKATGVRKPAMEQRALRVLRGWRVDPLFHSPMGRPARLSLRGDRRAFPQLVKTYAGDVTPIAVLKELQRLKLIAIDGEKVCLRTSRMRTSAEASLQLAELARVLTDFASTASRTGSKQDPPGFFGLRESLVSTEEQASLFHRTYSRRAALMLESIEQWAANQRNARPRPRVERAKKRRIGLGIYLISDSVRLN
jgi:hypothetical protein